MTLRTHVYGFIGGTLCCAVIHAVAYWKGEALPYWGSLLAFFVGSLMAEMLEIRSERESDGSRESRREVA